MENSMLKSIYSELKYNDLTMNTNNLKHDLKSLTEIKNAPIAMQRNQSLREKNISVIATKPMAPTRNNSLRIRNIPRLEITRSSSTIKKSSSNINILPESLLSSHIQLPGSKPNFKYQIPENRNFSEVRMTSYIDRFTFDDIRNLPKPEEFNYDGRKLRSYISCSVTSYLLK